MSGLKFPKEETKKKKDVPSGQHSRKPKRKMLPVQQVWPDSRTSHIWWSESDTIREIWIKSIFVPGMPCDR